MLEKAAAIKRFGYLPLGKKLKAWTCAAEKQYQKLDKVFESNKKEEKILKSCAKSNLVYSKDFTFYKHRNIKEFARRSFDSNENDLIDFKDMLELFYDDAKKIKPNNEDQEKDLEKRKIVVNTASKIYVSF